MAGKYYMIKSAHNGLALTTEGSQANAKVTCQDLTGDDNQVFYDDPATSTIRNKATNFCLDIENDTLVVRPYQSGDPNQQWVRDEKHIRNKADKDKAIDIYEGKKEKGATVGAYKYHGHSNQCWSFDYVGGAAPVVGAQTAARREFYIISELHGKVLDICREDIKSGAKVIMYDRNQKKQKKNQLWYLDGHGYIHSALNDFVLFNADQGQPIVMQPYSESPRFQWKLDGRRIVNKLGEVLDIAKADKDNGAEVISYKDNQKKNQQWRFDYIDI